MDAEFFRLQAAEREIRRARLPGWAEWAAWRWSGGDIRQGDIGTALGGVLATEVSAAIKDYLFVHTGARFWLGAPYHGHKHWQTGIHGAERKALLREHFAEREPAFPGLVIRKRVGVGKQTGRNRRICELRRGGRTLASLGAEFGICSQRVRQICRDGMGA
jgi:hypothetical protein